MKKKAVYLILFLSTFSLYSRVGKPSDLFRTLKTNDSLLFDVGFNTCDTRPFENLLSNNFEFYHDKAGVTSSKDAFIKSIKEGLCKLSYKPRRQLDETSLIVYPLEKEGVLYGAIQKGTHRFYAIEKNKPEYLTSIADFTHVWLLESGSWKLSRCLSYNHRENEAADSDTVHTTQLFKDKKETEKWLANHKIPILGIGYIKDGKLQDVSIYGELEKGKPAPNTTIFNVASLTKPVTALVALKLVSLGKWSLDEPVCNYWTDPDIAEDPRHKKLTTRLILSHQTGFPNWRWMNEDKKLSFLSDPGTTYNYSGEGFEYLRKALEKKFQKSLQQLANELIFQPLKMYDTKYVWDKDTDTARVANGYDQNGNAYETVKHKTPNAADDLLTTVGDYGKFLLSVMNGEGLTKQVFHDMMSNQVATSRGKHFGLGFELYDLGNGEYAFSHGGSDKGVRTIVFIFPKTKQGLLIFTNSDNGTILYDNILKQYLGDKGEKIVDIEMK